MKTQNSPKTAPQSAKKKMRPLHIAAIAVGALVVLVGAVVYGFSMFVSGNYAKDTAKPLEQALVSNGAVKKCEVGDDGRGADNREPWYGAYFELPANREKATDLINKIATDNGYKLTQGSPSNRGHLDAVADVYLDRWFFDTSKKSPHGDLNEGQIELSFALYNNEKIELSHLSCKTEKSVVVNNDTDRTAVSINVKLPRYK